MPRKCGKPKQTRLSFNPVASTPCDTTSTNSQEIPGDQENREANLRYRHPYMPTLRHGKQRLDIGRQERLDQSNQRQQRRLSPQRASTKSSGKKGGSLFGRARPRNVSISSDEEEQEPVKSKQNEATTVDEDRDSDLKLAHGKDAKRGEQSSKRRRSSSSSEEESERNQSDESDADEVVSRPRRKLRRGGASKLPVVINDDDDEDNHAEHKSNDSKEEDGEDEDDDDDDNDDEDEPVVVTPARRKRNMASEENPQTPKRDSDQDKIDIEEDLEDLQDSGMCFIPGTLQYLQGQADNTSCEKHAHTRPTSEFSKEQKTTAP